MRTKHKQGPRRYKCHLKRFVENMFSSQDMGIFSQAKRVSQSRLNIHIEDLDGTGPDSDYHPPDFFSLSAARLACTWAQVKNLQNSYLSHLHLRLLLRGGLASILLLLGLLGRPASSLGLLLLLVVRLGRHGEYLLLSEIKSDLRIMDYR